MSSGLAPAQAEEEQLPCESPLVLRFFEHNARGFFVDVGANEPKKGSQSWSLEQRGWRGILVEPQRELAERLRRERPLSQVVCAACGPPGHPSQAPLYISDKPSKSGLGQNTVAAETQYVGTETVSILTVDEILESAGNPSVDFVSIDVEGFQLEALQGFSLSRHRPPLVLVEDHLYCLATHRHMHGSGYKLVKRTGLNNWYVPKGDRFSLSTWAERMALWKKVYLNTPFRKLRVRREYKRAGKKIEAAAHTAS